MEYLCYCKAIHNYLFIIKMTTKSKMQDAVIIWFFSEFLFHLFSFSGWRIKFLLQFFFNCNFDFFSVDKIKRNAVNIIYQKIVMWVDERMINYEWPKWRSVIHPSLPMVGQRQKKPLILITLDSWKRRFWEKNYIKNYFYLLKNTKSTKTTLQK